MALSVSRGRSLPINKAAALENSLTEVTGETPASRRYSGGGLCIPACPGAHEEFWCGSIAVELSMMYYNKSCVCQ
jgi:hypothetical protein